MSRHRQLESLFLEAAALPEDEREAFLEARCASDPALKQEVLGLIARESRPDTPSFAPLVGRPGTVAIPDSPIPEAIGPYRIVRRLGEGGFGEVFEAEQEQPVRRRVALKVLKAGMDTRAVLARFEAERQALALMNHPGVARVLDAGATESGRPYFAMELVAGEPITDWCERRGAGIGARIELMIAVCRAVEHAHQKGVIHRDLKPSNILVAESDGGPVPKVIDFGIAKATLPHAEGVRTRADEFLGTPEYMSPEQAASGGVDVDTRTDVYSLGVVLYQLLSGRLPFESERLRGLALDEMRRVLRDEEPPRPSERSRDSRALRGELDWIVMRAMEKDRSRRYASPATLADDLGRHLREEPVEAGPPTLRYRLAKLVRRRRGVVLAAAAVLAAVTAGVAATAVQAIRASRAEAEARRQALAASAVNEFLLGMLAAGNPEQNPGAHAVTLRDVVDRAVADLGDSAFADAAIEAGVRSALATTLLGIGRYADAVPLAERALALTPVGDDARLDRTLLLARALSLNGARDSAEAMFAGLAPAIERAGALERLGAFMQARGSNYAALGRLGEADSMLARSVAIRRDLLANGGRFRVRLASSLGDLSEVQGQLGRLADSEASAREAVETLRATPGDHHGLAVALGLLGSALRRQGRYAGAESLYRASIDVSRRAVGGSHPIVGDMLGNLGLVLQQMGRAQESEEALREAREILVRSAPGDHPMRVVAASNLAVALQLQGRFDEARALYEEALATARLAHAPGDPRIAIQLNNLGSLHRLMRRYDLANPLFVAAESIFVARYGTSHPQSMISRYNQGKILLDQTRFAEAEPHLREAMRRAMAALPPGHPNAAIVQGALGHACLRLHRTAEAESLLTAAYATLNGTFGPRHERTAFAAEGLAEIYRASGRGAEARRLMAPAPATR